MDFHQTADTGLLISESCEGRGTRKRKTVKKVGLGSEK